MSNKTIQLTDALYRYLLENSVSEHDVLKKIRQDNSTDQLTSIMQIAPEQGQFMALLIKLLNVKRVLEVGTSTGYSSLVMSLALPSDAGVSNKISLQLGSACEKLTGLIDDGLAGVFDMAFIDADKTNYDNYFEACMTLVREGGLILIDNVLWGGAVVDVLDTQADTIAIRELNKKLYRDKRVEISMLPVADGLTLVHKKL